MKKLIVLILALCLVAPPVFAGATQYNLGRVGSSIPSDWFRTGKLRDFGTNWAREADRLIELSSNPGTGRVWYVDSGVSNAGDGSGWLNAVATLNAAIVLSEADSGDDRGDVFLMAQGHAEDVDEADEVDVTVSGAIILGLGNGELRPKFSYTDAAGEIAVGADDVVIANIICEATVTAVLKAIDIEAGMENCAILDVDFKAETDGTDEFIDTITVKAASDRALIAGCLFDSGAVTNAGPQAAINFLDCDNMRILNNTFFGDCFVACIENETTASNFITIIGNELYNGIIGASLMNTEPCIELVATTTGIIHDNRVFCDVATPEAAIVGADMMLGENFYSEVESSSPLPMGWTTDSLQNKIGVDDGANLGTTSSVVSDPDGSLLERSETILSQTGSVDFLTNLIGFNDAANLGVTGNVTSDGDGSVVERLEFVQQSVGIRTIEKSLASIASGANDIFAVTGGPIKITEFVMVIDTNFAATGCLIGGLLDITTPAGTIVFGTDGTAFEFNNAQAGTLILWNGVLATDFTAVVAGAALSTADPATAFGLIAPVGMIELTSTATNAGTATVFMSYIPLGLNSVVTAQ